jgi:hypothetical protein
MIDVTVDRRVLRRAEKILAKVPDEVALAAYDRGLREAGNVVAVRARAKAPRGDRSGQSPVMRSRWSQTPLNKLIKVKVIGKGFRKGSTRSPAALVGTKYPDGNQIHFVHPNSGGNGKGKASKQQIYWGKGGRRTPKENDFLKEAFDTTRSQQMRAFVRALVPEIRRNLTRAKRGG